MARVRTAAGLLALLMLGAGCARTPEARRDKFVARGKDFLAKHDYSRAALQFKSAAQATPKDAEVYYQLGLAYLGLKDYRSAYLSLRRAVELNPKHVPAQLKISQLLAATNEPDLLKDAQERLETVLRGGSGSPDALNTLALTDLKLGHIDSAVQNLERALSQSPGELTASVMLARAKLLQKDAKAAEDILNKACASAPKSPDARRLLAEFYIDQKRLSEAESQLRRALELDPKNGPALMDLARLELTVGRLQDAEQHFKQLSALDGYRSIYAVFLLDQNRRNEAVAEFERIFQGRPDDRQARTNLAAAYTMCGRMRDAEKLLSAALKNNPKDSDALLQRGEILIQKGDYAQAEADLNQVRRLRPNAPEVHYVLAKLHQARGAVLTYRQELSEALTLNPNLQSVRVELAQHLVNNKDARAALDLLNAAPEFQKTAMPIVVQRNWALWALGEMAEMRKGIDNGLTREKSPDLLIQDALWKLRSGSPAAARAALEEALKIDPADLRALSVLSQTYISQKNGAIALERVKEYAARQPKSAPVQDFLGVLLLSGGNRREARKAFEAAKSADPQFVKADLSLAQVDVAEGKIDDARKRLDELLARQNTNATAHLWLGNLEIMKGNINAAAEHLRKAVEANPTDAEAANNLAYVLAEYRNQPDEALKYAQKAVELVPDRASYCDTLGWVLYHKGLYSSAIPYLERANSSSEHNVIWKYHLAMAYAKAGDANRSRMVLAAAMKINPNLPEAKIAQQVVDASR